VVTNTRFIASIKQEILGKNFSLPIVLKFMKFISLSVYSIELSAIAVAETENKPS
jgi:hypothetical protein